MRLTSSVILSAMAGTIPTSVSSAGARRNGGAAGSWPWILPAVELFHSGTFREGEFDSETGESLQFNCSPADIATMVENFKRFSEGERPPLTPGVGVGHEDDEDQLFSDDATLTYGEILRVWAETREIDGTPTAFLLGDLAINDEAKRLLESGQLTRVSAEIKETPPDGCEGDGCTLVRCVLLGLAPAGAKRLNRLEPSTIHKGGSVRRMSGVQRVGDRVFMFSGLSTGMRLGGSMGKRKFSDMSAGVYEDDDETDVPVTMADEYGEDSDEDMGEEPDDMVEEPGADRDVAMSWLTDNGFDPVALKIDDSTPDEAVAGIVAALRRVVGAEGDEHNFAWEAFTTRKGTIGARGTGEHSGTAYGAKAKKLLESQGTEFARDDENLPEAEPVANQAGFRTYEEEVLADLEDSGAVIDEPYEEEDILEAELASEDDIREYEAQGGDESIGEPLEEAEPVEDIAEPASAPDRGIDPKEERAAKERARWDSDAAEKKQDHEWLKKQTEDAPTDVDGAVDYLSRVGGDASDDDVGRFVYRALKNLPTKDIAKVARQVGAKIVNRTYDSMSNQIYNRVQELRKSKKFSDRSNTVNHPSNIIRLTTALKQVQQELVALKRNSQLLSRRQAREQIHTFCDAMVREGRMSPAAAERPSRENPQGGEDYARLLRALTDTRRLNVVHRFSDGKVRRVPKTVLEVEMATIRSRQPVHRFSERIMGRTGSSTASGDPSKSFDDWSKKHYEAELAKHSKK